MIWTGTWALLTSKDLITPVPPHNTLAGASVWCQTLQGSSKVSARFLQGVSGETHGDLYCQSHILTPVDGTLLAWLMLAWGLSAPSGASATTSHVSTPLHLWKAIGTVTKFSHPLPCSPIFILLGAFCLPVFIPVLISVNMLPSLSPNREWILKQGDHFMEIRVLSWMRNTCDQRQKSCCFNSSRFIQWCNWLHRNPRLPGSW